MSWWNIIKVSLEILEAVFHHARAKGTNEALEAAKEAALMGLRIANEAREEVRADVADNPSKLRNDDGFRRSPAGRGHQ